MGDYALWNNFQSLDRPENHLSINRFCTRYGRERAIAGPMEADYLGVNLSPWAIEVAGSIDIPAIRQALRDVTFGIPAGVDGPELGFPVRLEMASLSHVEGWAGQSLGKQARILLVNEDLREIAYYRAILQKLGCKVRASSVIPK